MKLLFFSIECYDGSYGKNCSSTCVCQNGALCNNIDGQCTCQPGWDGANCEKPCKDSWGLDCKNNFTCVANHTQRMDHVTGKCFGKDGFVGSK